MFISGFLQKAENIIAKKKRMAEEQVFNKGMFEEVCRRYDLGKLNEVPMRETRGRINNIFRVQAWSGDYIMRAKELTEWEASQRAFEHKVTDFLYETGCPIETPYFLPNDEGDKITKIGALSVEVYRRLSGIPGDIRGDGSKTDIISLAAQYHQAIKSFPKEVMPDRHESEYDQSGWLRERLDAIEERVRQDPKTKIDQVLGDNRRLIVSAYDLLQENVTPREAELPIHSDMHAGNIIIEGDKVKLIDFGSVRPGTKAGELWAESQTSPRKLSEIVETYREIGELSDEEVAHIRPEGIFRRLHGIRWTYEDMRGTDEKKASGLDYMIQGLKKSVKQFENQLAGLEN
ncbi:MAG TPA: hypothetical protein EYQ42_08335 [Thiotrichaceae bacterium]|nr:hypothetical protein [Thiotrichaceae bacterium]HIL75581.1 hypothetical protein [Rhodospirillales bacterium]